MWIIRFYRLNIAWIDRNSGLTVFKGQVWILSRDEWKFEGGGLSDIGYGGGGGGNAGGALDEFR